jgi:hypothetical protein
MVRALPALLTLLPLCALSCLRDYGDAPFACASSICPEGYRCVEAVCRREGTSSSPDGFAARRDGGRLEAAADRQGDSGAPASAESGAPAQLPDLGPGSIPQGKTCAQIMACCTSCSTEACCNGCFNAGSIAGKAKYGAVEACYDAADYGVCDSVCSQGSYAACWDCIRTACQGQITSCQSA